MHSSCQRPCPERAGVPGQWVLAAGHTHRAQWGVDTFLFAEYVAPFRTACRRRSGDKHQGRLQADAAQRRSFGANRTPGILTKDVVELLEVDDLLFQCLGAGLEKQTYRIVNMAVARPVARRVPVNLWRLRRSLAAI